MQVEKLSRYLHKFKRIYSPEKKEKVNSNDLVITTATHLNVSKTVSNSQEHRTKKVLFRKIPFIHESKIMTNNSIPADVDLYQILSLAKSANPSENDIKKAFYTLALACHPEKHPEDADKEIEFLRINEAYGVLSNADRKEIYDKMGGRGLKLIEYMGVEKAKTISGLVAPGATDSQGTSQNQSKNAAKNCCQSESCQKFKLCSTFLLTGCFFGCFCCCFGCCFGCCFACFCRGCCGCCREKGRNDSQGKVSISDLNEYGRKYEDMMKDFEKQFPVENDRDVHVVVEQPKK